MIKSKWNKWDCDWMKAQYKGTDCKGILLVVWKLQWKLNVEYVGCLTKFSLNGKPYDWLIDLQQLGMKLKERIYWLKDTVIKQKSTGWLINNSSEQKNQLAERYSN